MASIFNGRYTAKTNQPFVVSLIGMRINKWWRLNKWLPVARVMTPMMQTLFTNPEKGFLHAEFFWNFHGPGMVQYWRSFEDLERFARHPSEPHLAAWREFNQAIGADGSVGIWHGSSAGDAAYTHGDGLLAGDWIQLGSGCRPE